MRQPGYASNCGTRLICYKSNLSHQNPKNNRACASLPYGYQMVM